jgi:hypothetical protein
LTFDIVVTGSLVAVVVALLIAVAVALAKKHG